MQHNLEQPIEGSNTGKQAEEAAATFLTNNGYDIVAHNFLCKGGEIDIIARQKKQLIFVEVRFRKSALFGGAAASVSQAKQKKVILAAQLFLQSHKKYAHYACRFDVIALNTHTLQWIQHAFDAYS